MCNRSRARGYEQRNRQEQELRTDVQKDKDIYSIQGFRGVAGWDGGEVVRMEVLGGVGGGVSEGKAE